MPYDLGVIKRQRREEPTISTSTYGGNFVGFYSSGTDYYAVHVFTSSGQFTKPSYVTTTTAQVLVVAGGGGGGGPATASGRGGGGGAGGVINSSTYSITSTLTIQIGAGGATNVTGSVSTVTDGVTVLTASGGGSGGAPLNGSGAEGGSGGGGSGTGTGGSSTSTQGNIGGGGASQTVYAGGGGGASAVGGAANAGAAGAGGSGTITLITGSPIWVAGGGGGGANATGYNNGSYGGGGSGGTTSVVAGTAGATNSGGGGGGGGGTTGAGGAGGSGIVIISYAIPANLYPKVQSDPYFSNNALLLNVASPLPLSNSSNVVENIISDFSVNANAISNFGAAASSTLNPFDPSSYHSLYFNGNAYLTSLVRSLPATTTDFTIEFWMYAVSSDNITNHWLVGSAESNGFYVFHRNNYISIGQIGLITYTSPTAFSLNQWVHVAVVRSSNIFYIYQNGNVVFTQSWNPTFVSGVVNIGGLPSQGAFHTGYLSNIRATLSAVYTGNFIVPSQQLSTIQNALSINVSAISSGVTLLTGRFSTTSTNIVDYSTLTNTISVTGVTASSLNPFTDDTYNSIQFNGNNYLSATRTGGWLLSSADYTVEAWVNLNTVTNASNSMLIAGTYGKANITHMFGWELTINNYLITLNFKSDSAGYNPIKIKTLATTAINTSGQLLTDISLYNAPLFIDYYLVQALEGWIFPTNPFNNRYGSFANMALYSSGYNFSHGPVARPRMDTIPGFDGATQTFTLEAWIFIDPLRSGGIAAGPIIQGQNWAFGIGNDGTACKLQFVYKRSNYDGLPPYLEGPTHRSLTSTASVPIGQWVHVAFVKNENPIYPSFYINGVQEISNYGFYYTGGDYMNATNTYVRVGGVGLDFFVQTGNIATSFYLEMNSQLFAFISNARLVQGIAVYTGNFTVPTDNLTITQSSGTNISAIVSNTATTFLTAVTTASITQQVFSTSTWYHVAFTKSSNIVSLYVNGVGYASFTLLDSDFQENNILQIGKSYSLPLQLGNYYGTPFYGNISNFRIVNGTAVYPGNFTVPNGPLLTTQVANAYGGSNTQAISTASYVTFLTAKYYVNAQGSTGFVDYGTNNLGITPKGDPGQGTFSPFGNNWSTLFNGTTDHLSIPVIYSSSATLTSLNFGSNDWTIETWAYLTANTGTAYIAGQFNTSNTAPIGLYISANKPVLTLNNSGASASSGITITSPTALSTGTWNHIAAVRNSTKLSIFVNGVEQAYSFSSTPIADISINTATLSSNNVTLSNLNPYDQSPYHSLYFNGVSHLSLPANAGFNFGTGDFTIELWLYPITYGVGGLPSETIDLWSNTVGAYIVGQCQLQISAAGLIQFVYATTVSAGVTLASTVSLLLNAWSHVAVVRSGSATGNLKIYLNGSVVATSGAAVTQVMGTTGAGSIGKQTNVASYFYNGYISNLRIVKGLAVYTGALFLTPQTVLSTIQASTLGGALAISTNSTQLLVGRFVNPTRYFFDDYSSNNFTLTNNGGVSAANLYPPITSTSTFNSMYFNGSTQYLYVPGTSPQFAFGTGDFTIEMWIYQKARSVTNGNIYDSRPAGTGSGASHFGFGVGPAGEIFTLGAGTISLNTWYHIAIGRSGTTLTAYINGVQVYSGTDTTNWLNGTNRPIIGTDGNVPLSPGYIFNGYISNLRVVKGTAVYTSNFTPPSNQLTNVSGTSLLIAKSSSIIGEGVSGVAVDYSVAPNSITSVGSPTVSNLYPPITSTSTYYNSLLFNGSTQYLNVSGTNSQFAFGTGDFTIEMWIYQNARSATNGNIYDSRPAGTGSAASHFVIGVGPAGEFYAGAGTISLNTWYHIAVCRSGTNQTAYVNGVQVYSVTNTTNWLNGTNRPTIGTDGNVPLSPGYTFNGYISNLRVVKGVGVYTGNFTRPTQPLTVTQSANPYGGSNVQAISTASYTSLLTLLPLASNIVDYSTNTSAITIGTGSVSLSTLDPFDSYTSINFHSLYFNGNSSIAPSPVLTYAAGSLLFNGTTQYLSATKTGGWLSSDHTVEAWIYLNAYTSPAACIAGESNGSTVDAWEWYVTASVIAIGYRLSGTLTTISASTTFSLLTWYHVAFSRSGTTVRLFVNGVQVSSGTITSWTPQNILSIGYLESSFPYRFNGYITNFRMVNGTAVYTSNFTPLLPLSNITNTTILLLVNSDANKIVDSSSTPVTFTNHGVANFSSTVIPSTPSPWLNYGDHTVEAWVNLNTVTNANMLIAGTYNGVRTSGWTWTINNYFMSLKYETSGQTLLTRSFDNQLTQLLTIRSDSTAYDAGASAFATNETEILSDSPSPIVGYYGSMKFHKATSPFSKTWAENNAYGFLFGSGDFTIEVWALVLGTAGVGTIIDLNQSSIIGNYAIGQFVLSVNPVTSRVYFDYTASNSSYTSLSGPMPNTGWIHIAVVRSGSAIGNLKIYVNGSVVATSSAAITQNIGVGTVDGATIWIGFAITSAGGFRDPFIGNLSNLRIVKNLAIYTGNFTPQTSTPLSDTQTAGTNIQTLSTGTWTSLLLGVSTATMPVLFAPDTWNHVAFTRLGTTATMYINGVATSSTQITSYTEQNTLRLGYIGYGYTATTYLTGYISNFRIVSGVAVYTGTNFVPPTGILTTQQPPNPYGGTNTNAITFTTSTRIATALFNGVNFIAFSTNTNMLIGRAGSAVTSMFPGYLSNIRIVNGTAVYTSNFTPPRAPLSIVKNTSLLIAASNSFIDKSVNNFIVTTGTITSIPTITQFTPYKIPGEYASSIVGGSVYFNTTTAASQNLSLGAQSSLALGSGNYTVELWVYAQSYNSVNSALLDWRTNAGTTAGIPVLYLLSTGFLQWQNTGGTGLLTSPARILLNTWNHIAMVRYQSILHMFINGIDVASVADSTSLGIQTFFINSPITASNQTLFGFISNVRIAAGAAVYTPAFNVPTTSLTSVTNTTLLALQNDSVLKDNSSNNFTLTKPNTSTVFQQALSPFGGVGSAYFNGVNNYLTVSTGTSLAFAFDISNFTLEAWVYPTARNGIYGSLIIGPYSYPSVIDWALMILSSGNLYIQLGSSNSLTSSLPVPLNQWSHVACVRNFGILTLYINGQSVGNNINGGSSTIVYASGALSFNGSTQYLTAGAPSDWIFLHNGQQDYTIECWFYTNSTVYEGLLGTADMYLDQTGIELSLNYNGSGSAMIGFTRDYRIGSGFGPPNISSTAGGLFSTGVWNHIAVTFTSATTSVNIFINGVSQSLTSIGAYNLPLSSFPFISANPTHTLYVGTNGPGSGLFFDAYITNLRITKSVVYGGTFTSTLPLSTLENTQLLLLANSDANKLVDTAGNYTPLTNNGGVTYQSTNLPSAIASGGSGVTTVTNTINVGIGGAINGSTSTTFNGYITNINVIKNFAKYTSAFTPPTSDLNIMAGTSLLTLLGTDITFIDRSLNSFAITNSTTATTLQGLSPYTTSSWSTYFDGSSYLFMYSSDPLDLSTSTNWTIETWVNPTGNYNVSDNVLFAKRSSGISFNSIAFNGANWLSVSTATNAFAFGSNDFTIECWFYTTNGATIQAIVSRGPSDADDELLIALIPGGQYYIDWGNASSNYFNTTSGWFTTNSWYHLALVRYGNVMYLYQNGILISGILAGSIIVSGALTNNYPFRIGQGRTSTYYFTGYIANMRVVNGIAVYTGNFNPPKGPLATTQIENPYGGLNTSAITTSTSTTLLIGQFNTSNIISDLSINNVPIFYNNVLPAVLGPIFYNSVQFDGATQYLTVPVGASTFGTGDFTVECWFYKTAATTCTLLDNATGGSDVNYWTLATYADGHCQFQIRDSSSQSFVNGSIITTPATWVHVAVSRSSGLVKLFVNGVLDNSATITKTVTARVTNIGSFQFSTPFTDYFTGYISNVRLLTGIALYTTSTSFTVPPAQLSKYIPIGAVGTSAGIYSFSFVAGAAVDFTNPNFATGTGDFTAECWVYMDPSSNGNAGFMTSVSSTISGWNIARDFVGLTPPNGSGNSDTFAWTISSGVWTHVALTLRSGQVQAWLNGTLVGTLTRTYVSPAGTTISLGRRYTSDLSYPFVGYISNARFVVGVGVYTGAFSTPTQQLQTTQPSGTNIQAISTASFVRLLTAQTNSISDFSTTATSVNIVGGVGTNLFTPTLSAPSYSLVMNGSSYLTIGTASDWTFLSNGSQNYTLECWFYTNSTSYQSLMGTAGITSTIGFEFSINYPAAGGILLGFTNGISGVGNNSLTVTNNGIFSIGVWNHVAATFTDSSNEVKIFLNGQAQSTSTYSSSVASGVYPYSGATPSSALQIGLGGAGTTEFNGYINNVRVTKFVVYTGNFTVPPTILRTSQVGQGNIQNISTASLVSLLIGQSNIVTDNSKNNYSITNTGPVTVNSLTPFAQETGYDAGYTTLLTANFINTSTNITDNSNYLYTITQVNSPDISVLSPFGDNSVVTSSTSYQGYLSSSTGYIGFYNGTTYSTSTTALTANTWNHIAYTYDGNYYPGSVSIYVNGFRVLQTTSTILSDYTENLNIGGVYGVTENFYGYMSNFRIVKDSSLYLGSYFGVPTSKLNTTTNTIPYPLTSTISTSLLTLQDNRLIDNSVNEYSFSIVGTPKTITFSPFAANPNVSAYFNGTTDFINVSAQTALSFGTGDFTIEVWVYPTAVPTGYAPVIDARTNTTAVPWIVGMITSGGVLKAVFYDGTARTATTTIQLGTWTHIAWTRTNSILRMFVNGVVDYVLFNNTTNILAQGTNQLIGKLWDGTGYIFQGFMTNLRVVKGRSLYTGNFNPSQIPLTPLSGTATNLLTTFVSGRAIDYSGNSVIKANTSSMNVTNVTTKNNLYSLTFNGSTDFLTVSTGTGVAYNANDFTWELWVYPTSPIWTTTSTYFIEHGPNGGSLRYRDNKVSYYNVTTATSTASLTLSINSSTWTHLAVSRSNNVTSVFINGAFIVNTPDTYRYNTATIVTIGNTSTNASNYFQGYIEDLRITKGIARYTSSFVPPNKLSRR